MTNVIVDALGEDANEGCLNQLFIEMFTHNDGLFGFFHLFGSFWHLLMFEIDHCGIHVFVPQSFEFYIDLCSPVHVTSSFWMIMQDGVHFTILSGMNFVKALADQAMELIRSEPPEVSIRFVLVLIASLHSDPQFFSNFSTLDQVYIVYRVYRE